MLNSKRFDEWFPIFKGGVQRDTLGREHNGDHIINRIIQSFNPSHHEPPLTIGDVKESSPAFGWVSALKDRIVDGKRMLLAKFGQLHPAASGPLKGGNSRFGITIYKDGRLRQVALRGVTPPQIPVLENVDYVDGGEVMTFEFDETNNQDDPGVILDSKIQEILRNPPKVDRYGRPIENFSYRDAMNVAIRENQELASEYFSKIRPKRETVIA